MGVEEVEAGVEEGDGEKEENGSSYGTELSSISRTPPRA